MSARQGREGRGDLTLVTGADGFVGRHVTRALAIEGAPVRALDLTFGTVLPPGVEPLEADILDGAALGPALQGVDTVLHLAAISDLWGPPSDANRHARVNTHGTRTLLDAAIAAGARRFVYCSSNVVTLAGPRGAQPIAEDHTPPEDTLFGAYARSKHAAEALVQDASGEIETLILRPGTPIGPGDHRPTPPGVFLRDLANGAVPALPSGTYLNAIDVQVLAKTLAVSRYRGVPGSRYLLSGCEVTFQDLARIVSDVTGLPAPKARVPYPIAWTAALLEDRLWSRLTGRRPTASFDGLRMAGRARPVAQSRSAQDLGLAETDLTAAVTGALTWMRDAGWITRDLPKLP